MTPRTLLLLAVVLSNAAVGSAAATPSSASASAAEQAYGGDGVSNAAERERGTDAAGAGLLGWLRGLTPVRALLLVGSAVAGLVLVRGGYRRAVARYRAYTSPTVVLLDDAPLEDVEVSETEANEETGEGE